jgi:serine/threonine protein kinase
MNRATANKLINGFLSQGTTKRHPFMEVTSGTNGAIWKIIGKEGFLIKQQRKTNSESIQNALNEYEITNYTYKKLLEKGLPVFVPQIASNIKARNGRTIQPVMGNTKYANNIAYMLQEIPGVTLQKFASLPTTTQDDMNDVKRQCYAHVEALNKIGIIHGDLHPKNIMVVRLRNETLKVYFIDFGRARSKNTKIDNTKTFHHPYNTSVGCTKGNSRICALPYVNKVNKRTGQIYGQPSGKSNKEFLNAIFASNLNPTVSYNRRLENLRKILSSIETLHPNFYRTLTSYYTTNQNKKELNKKLDAYRNGETSRDPRIQENLKKNYNKVQNFIQKMKKLKSQKETLSSRTPTREEVAAFMMKSRQTKSGNGNFGPGR